MLNVINVDLDGVLYPWHEIVAKEWGVSAKDFTSWNIHEHLGVSEEVFNRWHEQQQRLGLWNRTDAKPPIEGKHALDYLSRNYGLRIRILTHRLSKNVPHSKVASDTVLWLDQNQIPYWELAFVGKDANKGLYLADFAIDDKPKNVSDMNNAGIDSWMLARTWNLHDPDDRANNNITNVGSWTDFRLYVENRLSTVDGPLVETEEPQKIS